MRIILVFVLLATAAAAQPTAPPHTERPGPLSPSGAVAATLLVPAAAVTLGVLAGGTNDTLAGVLIVGGALVGPSAGNLIQRAYGDALVGTGLRVGGATLAVGAFASTFMRESYSDTHAALAVGAVVGAGVLLVAGTAYDLRTSVRNADRAPATVGIGVESGGPRVSLRVGL